MATPQHRNQQEEMDRHTRNALDAFVAEHVIHILGKPAGLQKVQVRQVGEWGYRVNILIGPDAVAAKVAQSYFLKVDGDGNIVESTPKITRLD
jgi:hypothetical protein